MTVKKSVGQGWNMDWDYLVTNNTAYFYFGQDGSCILQKLKTNLPSKTFTNESCG